MSESQPIQPDQALAGPAGLPFDKYRANDVIVALPHKRMVAKKLADQKVKVQLVETAEEVGLARITLAKPEEAAKTLRNSLLAVQATDQRYTTTDKEETLVQILQSLRGLFAAELAGWTPTIGKNRMLGSVHGVGEIIHTGGGDPRLADGTLAPRLAGPGRGIRVGVLDTALYPDPWLAGGWVAQPSALLPAGAHSLYVDGHATFVTGLVLSQAPAATVEVRKVLENGEADSWTVAKEIVRFGRSGLDVLNLSFAGYTGDGEAPMALAAAVDRLPQDLVVIAAAGNHGELKDAKDRVRPAWPAALDDVIAVGSATADSEVPGGAKLARFTPAAPWMDLLAEGEALVSTYLPEASNPEAPHEPPVVFGGVAEWSGTSFSAALISGAIAAATDPDRFPARAALDNLMATAQAAQDRSDVELARSGTVAVADLARLPIQAPFVPLRTPSLVPKPPAGSGPGSVSL